MADFTFGLEALAGWQREQAVTHFTTTYHLAFGSQERIQANYFRCREHRGGCPDMSPVAVAWRDLVDQVKAGGPVKVRLAGFGRADRYRMSELLRMGAARAGRDGQLEVCTVLERVRREYDAQLRLDADELNRAEELRVDASRRERQQAAREGRRLKPMSLAQMKGL